MSVLLNLQASDKLTIQFDIFYIIRFLSGSTYSYGITNNVRFWNMTASKIMSNKNSLLLYLWLTAI